MIGDFTSGELNEIMANIKGILREAMDQGVEPVRLILQTKVSVLATCSQVHSSTLPNRTSLLPFTWSGREKNLKEYASELKSIGIIHKTSEHLALQASYGLWSGV